jgi:HD-GYP domain-containing protein (c-di-GMP phosphodiesterase class II)
VYDALTSPRVYKPPFEHEVAVRMIMDGECGTFNPKMLDVFQASMDQIKCPPVDTPLNGEEECRNEEEMSAHRR